jgi:hypothetical protein
VAERTIWLERGLFQGPSEVKAKNRQILIVGFLVPGILARTLIHGETEAEWNSSR